MFIGESLRQPHDRLGSVGRQVGHGFAEVVVVERPNWFSITTSDPS